MASFGQRVCEQVGDGKWRYYALSCLLLGLVGCLGLREAVAELRTDITGSLVAMEEAALEREQAFNAALFELNEARTAGTLTPEEYAEALTELMQDDLLAQGREGRALAGELKADLETFHDEIEAQLRAARSQSVDWGSMLAGLAVTLLGGGGAAAGLAGHAGRKASAYADKVALEQAKAEARAATDALNEKRNMYRIARGESVSEKPQGYPVNAPYTAPIVPSPTVQGGGA